MMLIRRNAATILLTLLFALTVPAVAAEKIYHIRAGATVDHAAGVYPDLESLRLAILNGDVYLDNEAVIQLYNDDRSLTERFEILPGREITFRSAGDMDYLIGSKKGTTWGDIFYSQSSGAHLRFHNVTIGATGGIGLYTARVVADVDLSVSNSTFATGNLYDIYITGNGMNSISLHNTIFENGYGYAVYAQDSMTDLNISFDANANRVNTWSKGIILGSGTVNVDVGKDKAFDMQSTIQADSIRKTGDGTWKVQSGSAPSLTIQDGTMHITGFGSINNPIYQRDSAGNVVTGDDGLPVILFYAAWVGNSFHVGKDAVFKPTIHKGNLEAVLNGQADDWYASASRLVVDSFSAANGARLEIGGISTMPQFDFIDKSRNATYIRTLEVGYSLIFSDNANVTVLPESMSINNALMQAALKPADLSQESLTAALEAKPEDWNGYLLHIERVENLATLDGLGSFADQYRKAVLTDDERDLLDAIYCAGTADGGQLGYLQTLGGYHIQNTLLAMRHNQANMMQKVNRRITGYQKEDIYDLSVKGGEVCDYSEWDACTDGGEMWAFLEQTWMSQNDVDSLAGYRYQTHTLGLGYDWHTGSWIYGGVLNYSAGKMKLRNNYGAYTDIDQLLGSLYVSYAQDGIYLTGAAQAGYGWNDSTSRFTLPTIDVTTKTGNYSTSTFGASMEGGYMWETEFMGAPMRVTPYGNLTYARLHRGSARETGGEFDNTSMNRHFHGTNWHMWEFAAGARVAMPIERDGYILIPSADIAYTRTLGSLDNEGAHANFLDRDQATWRIPVMASNRSAVRMSANLDARIKQNLTIGAGYEFEWRHRYWKHQLNVGMSLGF